MNNKTLWKTLLLSPGEIIFDYLHQNKSFNQLIIRNKTYRKLCSHDKELIKEEQKYSDVIGLASMFWLVIVVGIWFLARFV
jgi:hypothetical protein